MQENYQDEPHVEAQVAMLIANQAADNDNQVSVEQVRRQLDATKENYRTVLARNQQESAEMARKAGEVLGEIDKISASLGKKDGEAPHPEPDKAKNGLREVLNNLRPKTEE